MRYYFHVDDGTPKLDAEGLEFADDKAAWHQATQACAEILHDIDGALKPGDDLHMEVRDQTGRLCFTLAVNTSGMVRGEKEKPATP